MLVIVVVVCVVSFVLVVGGVVRARSCCWLLSLVCNVLVCVCVCCSWFVFVFVVIGLCLLLMFVFAFVVGQGRRLGPWVGPEDLSPPFGRKLAARPRVPVCVPTLWDTRTQWIYGSGFCV